jgi:hypothetical protein
MSNKPSKFDRAVEYALGEVKRVRDPDKLPTPVRTVVLIHAAQGIMDKRGLQYFFEADFHGQPPYSVFVDAYRTIGANDAAQALADAVRIFPFADPHRVQSRRDNYLEQFLDDGTERPDSPFKPLTSKLCGNKEVWRLLEAYVELHADSFPR